MQSNAVLHFAFTKVMENCAPLWVLPQIIGNALGQENVPCVAAIHHSLRDVDASAGDGGLLV